MAIYVVNADLKQFKEIVKHARFNKKMGKRNIAREKVEIRYKARKLKVVIAGVKYSMPATGRWRGIAVVPLANFQALRRIPPAQDPVEIVFDTAEKCLKIASTLFSVVPAETQPL